MFNRKLKIERIEPNGEAHLCPNRSSLDSFAMRNFTNDAIFDDTLSSPTACSKPEQGYPWIN